MKGSLHELSPLCESTGQNQTICSHTPKALQGFTDQASVTPCDVKCGGAVVAEWCMDMTQANQKIAPAIKIVPP